MPSYVILTRFTRTGIEHAATETLRAFDLDAFRELVAHVEGVE